MNRKVDTLDLFMAGCLFAIALGIMLGWQNSKMGTLDARVAALEARK